MKFHKAMKILSDSPYKTARRSDKHSWPPRASLQEGEHGFLLITVDDFIYPWVPTVVDTLADDWEVA
jgi:hypothetical protein